jgi:hypothetical protein
LPIAVCGRTCASLEIAAVDTDASRGWARVHRSRSGLGWKVHARIGDGVIASIDLCIGASAVCSRNGRRSAENRGVGDGRCHWRCGSCCTGTGDRLRAGCFAILAWPYEPFAPVFGPPVAVCEAIVTAVVHASTEHAATGSIGSPTVDRVFVQGAVAIVVLAIAGFDGVFVCAGRAAVRVPSGVPLFS